MTDDRTIRVTLLGCDREVLRLVQAVTRQRRVRIVSGCCIGRYGAPLRALVPEIALHDGWEQILSEAEADVVLVAYDQRETWREAALRKLVSARRVLWLVHPACHYLLAIELDVLSQAHGGRLVPSCPRLMSPGVARLPGQVAAWSAGEAVQSNVELELITPVFAGQPHRSRAQRAQDASLLRAIVGPLTSVSSAAVDVAPTTWMATVGALCGACVRWSSAPAAQQPCTELRARCGSDAAHLVLKPDATAWDGPAYEVARLTAIWDGTETADSGYLTWSQVCDDLEAAEAVERSSRSGQTVLLRERGDRAERSFQQRMVLGGCLLLVLFAVLLVGGTAYEVTLSDYGRRPPALERDTPAVDGPHVTTPTGRPSRPTWLRLWPAYPLLFYLLYQLARRPRRQDAPPPPRENSPPAAEAGDRPRGISQSGHSPRG